jgi:uncharacterized integral membrane protein
LFRLCLFLLLLGFALKNTEVVSLRFYFDTVWQLPLVMVLLAAFVAGAALGVLAALQLWFRQRRELLDLRRRLAIALPAPTASPSSETPVIDPTPPQAGHA